MLGLMRPRVRGRRGFAAESIWGGGGLVIEASIFLAADTLGSGAEAVVAEARVGSRV